MLIAAKGHAHMSNEPQFTPLAVQTARRAIVCRIQGAALQDGVLTSAGVRSALVRSGAEPEKWQPSSTFSRLVTRGTPIAKALVRVR